MNGVAIRSWEIETKDSSPEEKDYYESIFSQGNGYMGVRGYSPEGSKKNAAERSTFLAGFFEYIRPGITDMVNQPDFSSSHLMLNGYEVESLQKEEYSELLNMQDGTLTWKYTVTDGEARKTKVEILRFLSMADIHGAVIRFSITPINYDGNVVLETGIDGGVQNLPISDNQLSDNVELLRLWDKIRTHSDGTSGGLLTETKVQERVTAMEYRLATYEMPGVKGNQDVNNVPNADGVSEVNGVPDVDVISEVNNIPGRNQLSGIHTSPAWNIKGVTRTDYAGSIIEISVKQGATYIIDKFIAVSIFRDSDHPGKLAADEAERYFFSGFDNMLLRNQNAWKKIWSTADIKLEAAEELQGAVRYNIFQLIQSDSAKDPKASIGARGLMHGRYKGCYFWDTEIFMLPFFLHTNPEAAKNLLLYRYHTLEDAVKSSRNFSLEGARYSWMASDTGFEQCETWDTGCCEIHITADIAYAMGRYVEVTGDTQFLKDYAAEVYLQTARYWVSRFTYDGATDRFNLLFVKGPDEYCGVTTNNLYTVQMAVHNLKLALNAVKFMDETYKEEWKVLKSKLNFDNLEPVKWQEITEKAVTRYDDNRGLWIQDDTFEKLEPLDIALHKDEDIPLYHKFSFDRLQRYQVLKQPDVLMLMALFGEDFTLEEQQAAWDYYEPKTLHDSTLSFGIHGMLAAKLGLMKEAEKYFNKSVYLDLKDIMKNTAREGIHTAALGASWQALIFGYAGLWVSADGLTCKPHLPEAIRKMEFSIQYQENIYKVMIEQEKEAVIQLHNTEEKEAVIQLQLHNTQEKEL